MPIRRTVRRPARRRRNPDAPEAVLAAEALPLLSKQELAALSDNDFFDYRSTVFRLAFEAERYARKGSAEGDRAYAAKMRLHDYGYGFMQDMALKRLAAQEAAEKAKRAAAEAAKKAAAKAKRAATAAKKKAEAGFVGSNYFPASMKVRLGEQVYADEGDVFTVTGVASGSDPHNEQYATSLVASGILDKRNHRGDWAVIERGSDALLVSIGKGPKRNPRRRTVRRRKNSMGADAMYYALQQKRIPWSKMSRAQIEAVMQDAAAHGDAKLYARAKAALARR